MTKSYDKPFLTFEQLTQSLKDKGMIIDDEVQAKDELSTIGYYRLKAYSYPFKEVKNGLRINEFKPNTNWKHIINLYHFDRKLRLLVMEAIEWIEVILRTQVMHFFSERYGAFGYSDKDNFHKNFKHKEWIEHIEREGCRSKNLAIEHFEKNYNDKHPPLWMLIEVMSFGSLSKFYSGLKIEDQQEIAQYFKTPHAKLKQWLHVFVYVRNICAHHSRLWNTTLRISPKKLNDFNVPHNKIFIVLLMLSNTIYKN